MYSLLGLLYLLSTLIAPGYFLSCTQCLATIGSNCTGGSVTCPSGNVCGSSYTVTNEGTKEVFARSCVPQEQCDVTGTISVPSNTIKLGVSCCDTDNCIPPKPSLPEPSKEENGIICRTCVSDSSDSCYTGSTMKCTGNETMCLLQSTKLSGPVSATVALRGCSTKSICDLGSQSAQSGSTRITIKFVCTDGSSGLHHSNYLLAIITLMLGKFLSVEK
ncbi:phospholipase A2 inhibitor and Ly6/PLAUR domain-containing protein-like [Pelodytes ibericus]